jgi:hypothetical protein
MPTSAFRGPDLIRKLRSVLAVVIAFTGALSKPAQAQTLRVLHNFTNGQDGSLPVVGLTIDRNGNLFGTTLEGGYTGGGCGSGCGVVFKLSPRGSTWIFTPLYDFQGGTDGASPWARVILGPAGALYGTTLGGGVGSGIVFKLTIPPSICKTALCAWRETVLYRFAGGGDGQSPEGDLIFDQAGDMHGTTAEPKLRAMNTLQAKY